MNINQLKHEVLNENVAIEYDNGDLEKLKKVLEFIFPKDTSTQNINPNWKYYYRDLDLVFHNMWMCHNHFNGKSIPLSQITFDKKITLNDVIELRKKFPNNMMFGDEFDKLIKNLK